MNLNIDAEKELTYDAIVVGTGISGGWAAKELTEKGLKTLVLERGRMVEHPNYPTATKDIWEFENADRPTQEDLEKQGVQNRTGYTIRQSTKHWFVNDLENPYTEKEGKRFDWMRGYHVGGRSIMWGRQSYRWGDFDFEANLREGISIDWPVRYKEIAPWYDYVETFAGISGQAEGLDYLPDSKFLPPMEMNCVEKELKKSMHDKFGRLLTIGRVAHITSPLSHNNSAQRGQCQYRNLCSRGCPYGAYFSSNSSTLPAAAKTGNMTLRPNSIAYELIYDEAKGKATGVKVLDAETGEQLEFKAKVIFLCASTMGSTYIMMNSISNRFPNGFGNDSDQLGRNIMDHHLGVGASGEWEGFEDQYYFGRRANGIYIPRFRNMGKEKRDYLRGFGYQGGASRQGWQSLIAEMSIGADLKEAVTTPGKWTFGMGGFGEVLPYQDNQVTINRDKKDKHGLPTLTFDTELKENEFKMRKDMASDAAEMLEAAGFKNVRSYDRPSQHGLGLGIHEMGTARMGKDPKTSVLNKNNQVHACKNVFVTDGSFMTSANCVNPSLTYMAFTARAADFAVSELKKGNL
ncbi:MAG TPA: GMC family oxidoreductase [Cyclobacteriaceae bacterium]|jgi:choline dehydrogenase-like flavoprotein|nr:GMC family oxidoreductase [Cytophagales bacterium]HRE67869.1 GMC family oxidoreductase [Cyclobacteriaceae bacterium]HRF33849.1 GMC family oxidoreductase [Cyclobacteriaceae bacterium]